MACRGDSVHLPPRSSILLPKNHVSARLAPVARLGEAEIVVETWRRSYNQERPHSSLAYQMPAEFAAAWHLGSKLTTGETIQESPASGGRN